MWLVAALFFATFANRFAGLRSGDGEFSGGMGILRHYLPYRDYFTAGPPLNALKAALLLSIFPAKLITLRLVGVLERLLLASMVLSWLRQIGSARGAWLASLLTITLSAGDRTDPIASYNHDALLWAVAAGLLASCALPRQGFALGLRSIVSGVCAGCSLLTKQTVGGAALLVVVALPALLLVRRSPRRALSWFFGSGVGAAMPILVTGALLGQVHLLRPALRMMFITGPAAKAGHPGQFLARWGLVAWDNAGWVALGLFWTALAWRPVQRQMQNICRRKAEQGPMPVRAGESHWLTAAGLAGAGLIVLAELLRRLPALHDFTKSVVYASIFGLAMVVTCIAWQCLRYTKCFRAERLLLYAALSLATACSLSLSWPAFEAMLMPGLGLLTLLLFDGVGQRVRTGAYLALAFLFTMQLREKLNLPFGFDRQDEAPVYEATTQSRLPALAGMRLPEATAQFLDETTQLVSESTCPADTIFTYPEMGLLYTLTDRRPPTWSPSHNTDVVNDALAVSDAARLLRQPPQVLVTYQESEEDWKGAERLWREGRPSGQRALASAIATLHQQYRRVATYTLRAGDPPITVYLSHGAGAGRRAACNSAHIQAGKQ